MVKAPPCKRGVMTAHGIFRLMPDADGATDFGPSLEALVQPLCCKPRSDDLPTFLGGCEHLRHVAVPKKLKDPRCIPVLFVYINFAGYDVPVFAIH